MKRLFTLLLISFAALSCEMVDVKLNELLGGNKENEENNENNGDVSDIPNNQIWYTSTDGEIVEPYSGEDNDFANALTTFGANIISNTYENGQGIITFDGDVTKIGCCAFIGYDYYTDEETSSMQLLSIIIPNSVTAIEEMAFSECYNLTDVAIGGGVTTIGEDAFSFCESLVSVTIPDSVKTIEIWAFADCSSLREFKGKLASKDGRCLIIDGVLNSFAPAGLTEYTTPNGVTEIGEHAFSCYGSDLVNIVISNSVTTIRHKAFWACCEKLTSITIPNSVTTIENCAFEEIESLTNVYCKATTPPTVMFDEEVGVWNAFGWNAPDRKIYVPMESVEAYKNADGWSVYTEDIVGYDF